MSAFLTSLQYDDIDGTTWRLSRDLRYASELAGGVITVPVGFRTDLASIPRFFHRVIQKSGLWNWPAVVHDLLYQNNGAICLEKPDGTIQPTFFSKGLCDRIFLEAMKVRRVPWWKRETIYQAVNWFGGPAWQSHIKNNNGRVELICDPQALSDPGSDS